MVVSADALISSSRAGWVAKGRSAQSAMPDVTDTIPLCMRRFPLFRARTVPIPTVAGALMLAVLVCALLTLGVRALPGFLAANEPRGRGLLVVEGWITRDAVRRAADTFRRGGYDALVVSGGPVEDPEWHGGYWTYAERVGAELRRLGIVEPALAVVPAPASAQDRTYRSALSVRQWIESTGRGVTDVDVFSQGAHARRSRELYRMALGPGVAVGSVSAPPSEYTLARWWQRSAGVKEVLAESINYAWTVLWFRPGPRGSHEEAWAVPARAP
jgi:hypothetical protein